MGALQMTKMPTIHPEMGSFSFSPHQVESRSSPLLLQDTGISASIGGHIYSPVVPLPNVYVSSKWFEPNNRPDAFDLAISFNKRNDLASRNECSKDVGLPNDTNINPKTQQSSTSGSFKDGSDSTPNNPDGKSNSKVIEEPSHDSFVLPSEVDHTSVEALCFLLDKCTVDKDIAGGRFLHLLIISNGFDFVPELGDNLIRFFGSCASVLEADRLFSKLSVLGLSAWHTIMSAHAVHGDDEKVFQLYIEMVHASTAPNSFIFTRVVNSCASLKALKRGETVHKDIIYFGLQSDLFVANALIGFYSKCGSLSKARHVFVMLPEKNVVVWSSIIGAFIQEGYLEQSLELFREMEEHDFQPNEYTYSSLISACGNAANVVDGLSLHSQFVKSGLNLDSHMASSLIDMYAKCGCMIEARDVFDDLSNPALTCWSTLIAGYTRIEQDHTALKVYESMESKGCTPNSSTLCCSLRACGNLKAVDKGRAVHDQVIAIGLDSDEYIRSNLIDMYCQCGCLDDAKSVFDHWPSPNIVLWGALMAGYVLHDHNLPVLEFFTKMQKDGIKPNVYIYSCVLQACGCLGALKTGIDVHEQICKSGLEICGFLGSSLIGMYSKCGNLEMACTVFEELSSQNIVCLGAMMAGYVQHGLPLTAFGLYEEMLSEGMRPDRVIYMYILEACSIMGSSDHGKGVHCHIIASGLGSDMVVGNSLVHMYIKCDYLQEAQIKFQSLQQRNKISWDAMVVAHSQNSNFAMARDCLRGMAEEGFVADEILFTDILAACRRSGNIEESWNFFKMIRGVYGINPCIQHFGCMVNLLGEGGYLSEAEELIEIMPIPPDSVAWLSLLSACRAYRKVDLGFRSFKEVVRLDPGMGMAYVLLSSLLTEAGMLETKHMIDEQRKQTGMWKIPGRAWIEVNNQVHEFTVGDRTHPQSNQIYATLRRLASVAKDEGHVPQLALVEEADDKAEMADNSSEEALLGHCEKLAIAFGLCSTPVGATVRVVKNLRVCIDCHNVSKIISKVEKRDIIINDAYHVHHFSNGECSCENNLVSG